MKTLTALCFGVLLVACAPFKGIGPDTSQPSAANQQADEESAAQQLFIEGVTQLTQQQDPEGLLLLKKNFPESPWADQAEIILTLTAQISLQQEHLKQLQQQLNERPSSSQTTRMKDRINQCTAETQRLKKELETSNQRLEALRELTIELELKEP